MQKKNYFSEVRSGSGFSWGSDLVALLSYGSKTLVSYVSPDKYVISKVSEERKILNTYISHNHIFIIHWLNNQIYVYGSKIDYFFNTFFVLCGVKIDYTFIHYSIYGYLGPILTLKKTLVLCNDFDYRKKFNSQAKIKKKLKSSFNK